MIKTVRKKIYLVTVDHYSDFFEIDELSNMMAETIIRCCKHNFARHGIPRIVISDNGTHFNNKLFQKFASDWEFQFSTSSPYYPQSNGKSESGIKNAKTVLKKAKDSKTDVYLALLNWRNTPNKMDSSPVQRLYSRRTRSLVPVPHMKLKPEVQIEVTEKIERNKQRSKYYFDRSTRKMKPLEIGEPVFVKLKGADSPWTGGVIVEQHNERSYDVSVNDATYRRNRHDLKSRNISPVANNETATNEIPLQHIGTDLAHDTSTANHLPCSSNSAAINQSPVSQINNLPATRKSVQLQNQSTPEARPKRNVKLPAKFSEFEM